MLKEGLWEGGRSIDWGRDMLEEGVGRALEGLDGGFATEFVRDREDGFVGSRERVGELRSSWSSVGDLRW